MHDMHHRLMWLSGSQPGPHWRPPTMFSSFVHYPRPPGPPHLVPRNSTAQNARNMELGNLTPTRSENADVREMGVSLCQSSAAGAWLSESEQQSA